MFQRSIGMPVKPYKEHVGKWSHEMSVKAIAIFILPSHLSLSTHQRITIVGVRSIEIVFSNHSLNTSLMEARSMSLSPIDANNLAWIELNPMFTMNTLSHTYTHKHTNSVTYRFYLNFCSTKIERRSKQKEKFFGKQNRSFFAIKQQMYIVPKGNEWINVYLQFILHRPLYVPLVRFQYHLSQRNNYFFFCDVFFFFIKWHIKKQIQQ